MPLPHRTDLPPVLTADDAADRWCDLIGDDDPPGGELWVQVLDDEGRQHPALVVIEELPPEPDAVFVENLLGMLRELLAAGTAGVGAVAVALARPFPPGVHAGDLAWAAALVATARRHRVRVLGVHLVVRGRVEALA